MIGPNPSAPNGPKKRKASKAAKPSKAAKSSNLPNLPKIPKGGKEIKAVVTPADMVRVSEMLRDIMLLDWLDQCAGVITLGNGTVSLHFGGNHKARSVLTNAAHSLRHLVFEANIKPK
jgi:hypothetical protein